MRSTNTIPVGTLFMIILILSSCADSPAKLFDNTKEQAAYEQLLEDFDSPRYKWGYIDTTGALVLKNTYDDCRDFSQQRAAVLVGGLWGYIDLEGRTIVPARYRSAQMYTEELALVETLAGQYLFLDREGAIALDTLPYKEVYPFYDKLARVHDGSYYGFIDQTGTIAIPLEYQKATNFKNGYAVVSAFGEERIINIQGQTLAKVKKPGKLYHPSSRIARYKIDGKYRFTSFEGKDIVDKEFVQATDFASNYAVVFDGTETYRLSTSGNLEKLPYRSISSGGEGKWIYKSDTKCGYLHNDGQQLTLPSYSLCTRFRNGMAAIRNDRDAWGYLSDDGKLVIPPKYPLAWDFKDGRARMINQNGYGFINKQGLFVIDPYHIEVRDFYEGLARVQIFRN